MEKQLLISLFYEKCEESSCSRWYSGSGIYRDVSLAISGPVHVSLYGPQLTTPNIQNGGGEVEAKIQLHNDTAISRRVTVETIAAYIFFSHACERRYKPAICFSIGFVLHYSAMIINVLGGNVVWIKFIAFFLINILFGCL
ncbi:MAG: hypothetical protein IKV25_00390 [Clostridia bacterium]|nr:hypothetical protein [Clostridia bacterium]